MYLPTMSTWKQTEPIVDYALRHRVPFAVVPCCVFMRALGGHRVLKLVLGATHTAEEPEEAGAAGGEIRAVGGGFAVEKGGDGDRARGGGGSDEEGNAGAGSGGEARSKEGGDDAGGKAGDEEGAIVGVSADPLRLVSTYEDYLDYLQGKDPRIRRSFLNFRGRNVVLSLFDYA
jgi:hypothetical protein